jgi:hypothetical protein
MQHKFLVDLVVGGVSVAEVSGYAIIETNEFDPDDGWSIGAIWLDGQIETGAKKAPFWRVEQVELPQTGRQGIEGELARLIVDHLVNESIDEISEKFQAFLADCRDTAGEARFERQKHEVA